VIIKASYEIIYTTIPYSNQMIMKENDLNNPVPGNKLKMLEQRIEKLADLLAREKKLFLIEDSKARIDGRKKISSG